MRESDLQSAIRLLSIGDVRLFRTNVGLAWVGDSVVKLKNGDVLLKNARPFKTGVEGMSDLSGWVSREVTQPMVGKRVAIYTALEVKRPGHHTKRDRMEKQLSFIAAVRNAGGLAGMVESVEAAREVLGE